MGRKLLTIHNVIVILLSSKNHFKNDQRVDNLIRVVLEQRESKVGFSHCEKDIDIINQVCCFQPQCILFAKGYCNRSVEDVEGKEKYR